MMHVSDNFPSPLLIPDMLHRQAMRRPDALAVKAIEGPGMTYAQLLDQARLVSDCLIARGVRPGDRVVLWAHPTPLYASAVFGILEAGAAVVPVDPRMNIDERDFIISNCQPSALITDSELVEQSPQGLPCLNMEAIPSVSSPTGTTNFVGRRDSVLALIMYTSGSTKTPRGVVCPHSQVIFACTQIVRVLELGPKDIILTGLPMAFDYGLYQLFLGIFSGALVVLLKDLSNPLALPGQLARSEATVLPAVPSLLALLLESRLLERAPLPCLRLVTSTGEMFPLAHAQRLRELLPQALVIPMYGLTECKRVSIVPPRESSRHPASVGLPLPHTRVAVVNESGEVVPPGTTGELIVYGPHVAAGYWNAPEETRQRFICDPATGERMLRTGDSFYQDKNGYLYFVGRDGSFVKSGAHRIGTVRLESELASLGDVAESCVTGIPDPELGERIVVFVRSSPGHQVREEEIQRHLMRALPSSVCRPLIEICTHPLPKTRNGKIDRRCLAEKAVNRIRNGK